MRPPIWADAGCFAADFEAPILALAESDGENADDLFAAAVLAAGKRAQTGPAAAIVAVDDQRDPGLGQEVARRLAARARRPHAVIGHFSSPVAHAAAEIYRAGAIPLFLPGSSSTTICENGLAPVFQLFATDDGQVGCICERLVAAGRPVCLTAQRGNAGEGLARTIMAELDRRTLPWSATLRGLDDQADGPTSGRAPAHSHVVLGSKEFAARTLEVDAVQGAERVILSDDSYGSAPLAQIARSTDVPISVCFPALEGDTVFDTSRQRLFEDARGLLNRDPGPYFFSSYLAIRLAIQALSQGWTTPETMLAWFRQHTWLSAFGPLTFEQTGQSTGYTWRMQTIGG